MKKLIYVYEKIILEHPDLGKSSKYNNLSYYYRVKIEEAVKNMIGSVEFKDEQKKLC
jgi:hypothetical protein